MGMDVIELVMEVEDKFGIKIEDEEYELLPTVQDLHDLIVRKRRQISGKSRKANRVEPTTCLSLVAFVGLRRALVNLFDVPRNRVRPGTNLDDVFPVELRLARWSELAGELAGELGMTLPMLARPRWLRLILNVGWIPVAASLFWLALFGFLEGAVLLIGLIALNYVAWRLTAPLATTLEPTVHGRRSYLPRKLWNKDSTHPSKVRRSIPDCPRRRRDDGPHGYYFGTASDPR